VILPPSNRLPAWADARTVHLLLVPHPQIVIFGGAIFGMLWLTPRQLKCDSLLYLCTCHATPAAASDRINQNVWMTRTAGQGAAPYRLVVEEDGNVMILDAGSTQLWATNTGVKGVTTP
jgi:hypothetical protein